MARGARALGAALRGAGAIVALAPGLLLLANKMSLPPQLTQFLGILSVGCGSAVVLAVVTLRGRISKLKPLVAAAIILVLFSVGAVFGMRFLNFASEQTVTFTDRAANGETTEARYLKPLKPSPRLAQILAEFGGDYAEALHNPYYRAEVKRLMVEEGGPARNRLVIYMLLSEAFMIGSVVLGGWRTASFFEERAAKPAVPGV